MPRFTVRCYDDDGVPVDPQNENEKLPTVEATSAIEAAKTVRGMLLTDVPRPAMYVRAEAWPYGKPNDKFMLYEPGE